MRFRTAVAFMLVAMAAPMASHTRVTAAASATQQQAESLARKISQITQRGNSAVVPSARRTEVTEGEVNSWFVYRAGPYLPAGVTDPSVSMLGGGSMRGVATLDLEAIGRRKSKGGMLDFWSLLGGKVPVSVTGTLRAEDGRGRFEMQSAEVAGVPVPKAIVQELVSAYTADGVGSLDASFALPAKIRSIDVGRGQLVVVQ